jgi:UDP-N-acetylglucosamine 2-epimerase (non-hydrolysing)
MVIFGTRPEAIKMAPIVLELQRKSINTTICFTGQHLDLVKDVISFFSLRVDVQLSTMEHGQTLPKLVSSLMSQLDTLMSQRLPDLVLVHGDTATTLSATMTAFLRKIKVGHVEAGLRTHNLQSPWPEEANRVVTGVLSTLHFAPTEISYSNLINEGKSPSQVFITGNTVIDAVKKACETFMQKNQFKTAEKQDVKKILVTCHRRENIQHLEAICQGLLDVLALNKDAQVILPVHPNPAVSSVIYDKLNHNDQIVLCEPMPYGELMQTLAEAHLVVTDSGGLQEEAPALNKPVLVIRDTTERPEVLETGAAKLIGTNASVITKEIGNILNDRRLYEKMSAAVNPYGDGTAGQKIVQICINELQGDKL